MSMVLAKVSATIRNLNRKTDKMINRPAIVASLTLLAFMCAMPSASASASSGPRWDVAVLADSTVAPGDELEYIAEVRNKGDVPTEGEEVVTVHLPAGVTATHARLVPNVSDPETEGVCTAADGFSPVLGASDLRCTTSVPVAPRIQREKVLVEAQADNSLQEGEELTARYTVSGGGASSVDSAAVVRVASSPPGFGIEEFDAGGFDSGEEASTVAGGHPTDLRVSLGFATYKKAGLPPGLGTATPVEPLKDGVVLPPLGLLANPMAADTCSISDLARNDGAAAKPLCPTSSQVGTARIVWNLHLQWWTFYGPVPVYNMDPSPGSPATFGMNVAGSIVLLNTAIRTDDHYRTEVRSKYASEAFAIAGARFDFWGTPSASSHEGERACPGERVPFQVGPICPSSAPQEVAFLRNPTACTATGEGVPWEAHADSWFHPAAFRSDGAPDLSDPNWKSLTVRSHSAPGAPYAREDWGPEVGFEGCDAEPFSPALAGSPPEGIGAGQPSGFSFDLSMPQQGLLEPEGISESDLRKAVVTLPAGVRVNPSSASGLGTCSPAQVGLTSPVGEEHATFSNDAGACPESSKIGNVKIKTPLLDHELNGGLYIAQPGLNPFGSLLALYVVDHDRATGVNIKLAGRVDLDPQTGQITTTFDDNPQLPFEDLHLELKSGPRAPLTAPSACGTYATHSTFTGWSGKVVQGESSFTIDQGCGAEGFSPQLTAGTENPLAGSFSPFSLRLTRSDADQELGSVSVSMPRGLLGKLAGIPYCPEAAIDAATARVGSGGGAAELSSPSCPAASQIGTVTAGAGAGSNPFYVTGGKAYLAGPYKGAPLSLVTEVPAVAGPFDLGLATVRVALHVNPETTQITAISDPLPSILQGVPLQIRDLRVHLDRPGFTLNPTSCEPQSVDATVTSVEGATATPSQHFQAANCDKLAFKPALSLRLAGQTRRAGHPALRATLTMPKKPGANIGAVSVALPHSEFLAQEHIGTVCTRVQYAAGNGGGEQCPKRSIYGHARAFSPLLDQPLEGNVYLRSNGGERLLPDLVTSLGGQLQIDLVGRIDTDKKTGGIRTTFKGVPDAPVSKFVLAMPGGKKSLLSNNTNICRGQHRATVLMDGQNGKTNDFRPLLKVACHGGKHRRRG